MAVSAGLVRLRRGGGSASGERPREPAATRAGPVSEEEAVQRERSVLKHTGEDLAGSETAADERKGSEQHDPLNLNPLILIIRTKSHNCEGRD